jgi:uncharacterized protein YndB with AHSA1/START domain
MPGTVNLHRVFTAKPEKIYRAFIEPDAVASIRYREWVIRDST